MDGADAARLFSGLPRTRTDSYYGSLVFRAYAIVGYGFSVFTGVRFAGTDSLRPSVPKDASSHPVTHVRLEDMEPRKRMCDYSYVPTYPANEVSTGLVEAHKSPR